MLIYMPAPEPMYWAILTKNYKATSYYWQRDCLHTVLPHHAQHKLWIVGLSLLKCASWGFYCLLTMNIFLQATTFLRAKFTARTNILTLGLNVWELETNTRLETFFKDNGGDSGWAVKSSRLKNKTLNALTIGMKGKYYQKNYWKELTN